MGSSELSDAEYWKAEAERFQWEARQDAASAGRLIRERDAEGQRAAKLALDRDVWINRALTAISERDAEKARADSLAAQLTEARADRDGIAENYDLVHVDWEREKARADAAEAKVRAVEALLTTEPVVRTVGEAVLLAGQRLITGQKLFNALKGRPEAQS